MGKLDEKQKLVGNDALIDELDLEPIKFRLVVDKGWDLDEADTTEVLYKRFLLLCKLYPQSSFVPTNQIDIFWHEHILDTQKYDVDCQQIFGYFLHHFPYLGLRGEEDIINVERGFSETETLYKEVFGVELSKPFPITHALQ